MQDIKHYNLFLYCFLYKMKTRKNKTKKYTNKTKKYTNNVKKYNELYKKIKNVLTDIFSSNDSLKIATINIYLVALGVRPACLPFYENGVPINQTIDRILSDENKLNSIKNIPHINCYVGKITSNQLEILIYNKKYNISKYLNFLQMNWNKYNDNMNHDINTKITKIIGKILGYTCTVNFDDNFYSNDQYSIEFYVDNIKILQYYCSLTDKKGINNASKLFTKINKKLKHINKNAHFKLNAIAP